MIEIVLIMGRRSGSSDTKYSRSCRTIKTLNYDKKTLVTNHRMVCMCMYDNLIISRSNNTKYSSNNHKHGNSNNKSNHCGNHKNCYAAIIVTTGRSAMIA